jgi:hypothetical protein
LELIDEVLIVTVDAGSALGCLIWTTGRQLNSMLGAFWKEWT